MVRTRPTIILVMAILSIVFGSIWALVWFCSGVGALLLYKVPLPQAAGAGNPVREVNDLLLKEVPGYLVMEGSNYVLGLVLSLLMIIAGIGLLKMKDWARRTAIVSSAVTIIWDLVHFVYQWTCINPVVARWTKEFMLKQPAGTPNFTGFSENHVIQGVMAGAAVILSMGFPLVLLVVLLLPNVRAAFTDHGPQSEPGTDVT